MLLDAMSGCRGLEYHGPHALGILDLGRQLIANYKSNENDTILRASSR